MTDGHQAGKEPQRQDLRAGRDGYIAGRDQTINNYYPHGLEEYLAERARQRAVQRKDQARRILVSQDYGSRTIDHLKDWLSTRPEDRIGFIPLPTKQTYRFFEVTITNLGGYVIHNVEVEWRHENVPTGMREDFPVILPGMVKKASMPDLEGCEELSKFSALIKFRDKDDVLWAGDSVSGYFREIPDG